MKNKNAILIALFLLAALMIGSVHANEDGLDSSTNAIKDTSTSNEAIINTENTINGNDEAIGQAIANDENKPKTIENQENDPGSDYDESDEEELLSNTHSDKTKLGSGVEFTDQTIKLKANTQTVNANNPNAPLAYIRIPKSKTGTMYLFGFTVKLSDVKSKITKNGFTTYTIRLKDIKESDLIFEGFESGDQKTIDFKYKSSNGDICYESRKVIFKINKKAKTFKLKELINCEIFTSTYDIKSGRNKKYTIKLGLHSGKGIKGKILKVSINGVTYIKKTNSQGKIVIYPPKYLAPKQYQKVYTKFAGDNKYTEATLASDIQIYKNPKSSKSLIKAGKKTFNANLSKSYNAQLLSKGKAIKNAKLTMTIDNRKYVAKTNSKGMASFNLNKLSKSGTYSGTIVYLGDKKHYMTYKNVKLVVNE